MRRAVLIIFFLLPTLLPAQDLRPIYDARLELKPTKPTKTELNWLKRSVLPEAQQHWQEQENCEEGFSVLDVASGAFTAAKATQKAYMYQYCETSRGVSNNGIAIAENNQLVAHLLYEGSWGSVLGALPDINRNGLAEILMTDSHTGQGHSVTVISLIELGGSRVKRLGQIQVAESDCGVAEQGGTMSSHKLYVEPANSPVFYRDVFKRGCDSGDQWRLVVKREPVSFEPDETDYSLK